MKTIFRFILLSIGIFSIMPLSAQTDNILIDRDFWRSQPSVEEIQEKIDEGHSPAAMTSYNFDAVVYAILENNSLKAIKFLLTQGNDINKITHDARTYIFWAAYEGNVELMKYLVEQGAKTDLVDQHGYSIIMFAAATGQANKKVYEYCIELGTNIRQERDRDGRNVLLAYASSMSDFDMIEYFLDKGLDIHSTDPEGNGIFHYTAKTGNEEYMKQLIANYELDYTKNKMTNENAILFASRRYSRSGAETPLSFYKYLEGLGLDPAIVSNTGNTALQNLAYRSDNLETLKYFIEKGVDVDQVNEAGNNALMNAAHSNTLEVIELLVKHTDQINLHNEEGHTCLTHAIWNNSPKVVKYLIGQGASIHTEDENGNDLGYHLVDAYDGNMQHFKAKLDLLIKRGYDPKALQNNESTLLHVAIKKNDIQLCQHIISLDVDVNAKDSNGETALHYAAMQAADDDILKFLIASGADKNIPTLFGETVHDLASQNEMLEKNNVDIEFLR